MQIWRIMTLRSNHTRSVSVFLLTLFLLPSCHHLSTQYVVPPLPSLSISELLSWMSFLSGAVPDGGTDPWGQQNIWLQGIKLADFCLFCLFNHFPVLYRSTLSSHFSALKQDLHIFKYLFNITYVSHKCLLLFLSCKSSWSLYSSLRYTEVFVLLSGSALVVLMALLALTPVFKQSDISADPLPRLSVIHS